MSGKGLDYSLLQIDFAPSDSPSGAYAPDHVRPKPAPTQEERAVNAFTQCMQRRCPSCAIAAGVAEQYVRHVLDGTDREREARELANWAEQVDSTTLSEIVRSNSSFCTPYREPACAGGIAKYVRLEPELPQNADADYETKADPWDQPRLAKINEERRIKEYDKLTAFYMQPWNGKVS